MDEMYLRLLQDLEDAMRKAMEPFVNYYVNAFGKSYEEAWHIAHHMSMEDINTEMACCCDEIERDYALDEMITEEIYGESNEEFWPDAVVTEDIY